MSQTYSVIFAGTPLFALPSLEALIADPTFTVRLVISQPDRPVGRKQILTPSPVKICSAKYGIPLFQPEDMNKQYNEEDLNCDFLVVVAYGQIFTKEILDIPRIAPVNVHGSLLPRWRGASPMQHALLAGDTQTGITIQKMSETLDTGDILAQCKTPIKERETISSLHNRLSILSAELLPSTLKKPLIPIPQNTENITTCSKLTRADGKVDSKTATAEEIDLHVRALVPWPGVRCKIDGVEVKLLTTSLSRSEDALELPCAENTTLFIQTLQPSGKKPMSGKAWKHGHQK